MASCAVLGMTSSLEWLKASVSEDAYNPSNRKGSAISRSNPRGLSQFFRSVVCYRGVGKSFLTSIRNRRRPAADPAPHKHQQDRSTLQEAVTKLMDRINNGSSVNFYEYNHVLKWCSEEKDLESVKQVHDTLKDSEMEQHPTVGKMLLKCYIDCVKFETAQETFNKLRRKDTGTWNMMIAGCVKHDKVDDAIGMYKKMRNEGGQPDAITFLTVLKACGNPTALKWGREIHSHIMHDGFQEDVRIGSALVRMYSTGGSIGDARAVFSSMGRRNVWSWNVMIGALAQHGLGHEAFSMFLQMQREGCTPDTFTFLNILNPCSSTDALEWVRKVHAHAMRAGTEYDVQVGNALVHMYVKSGSIEDARAVFYRLSRRDVVSWNVMIGGLSEHGLGYEAFSLFLQMQREGFTPDVITYVNILNPCSSAGAVEWVKDVHAHATRAGLDFDVHVGNALVHMYFKSGSIEDAGAVFGRLNRRNVVSWNVMIGGLAEDGLGHDAFSLFLQMQREGFTPNAITYLNILDPCLSTSATEWVKEVHAHAMEAGLDVDVQVGTALVQMLAKTGFIADAKQAFDKMQKRDVISWAAMIGGLAQHGEGREALQLFEEMKLKGFRPNGVLFVAVLSACSHAGLVEEGSFQFASMRRDHGIEPALEHYTCMVDMLGRAGLLEEAKLFILNMPMKPDFVIWIAFLGACRTHRNIKLAELAAKECLKLKPNDAGPYVLLSNVYAAVGNWGRVTSIRRMMEESGTRKDPGRCWIEVDNKVHNFMVGATSHPETKEIFNTLASLSKELKAEGYIADTRLVLRNIAEEDKESALCSHSEKLAIAYGLMHMSPGKPIRVYKNLRICSDCHVVTKLISKITGREIVARDSHRFHLFKDGVCSCGDYW